MSNPVQGTLNDQFGSDILTATLVHRFRMTIDSAETGSSAPQGIHWCLGLPQSPTADLGEDGYPIRDDLTPKAPFPHRLWASSAIEFYQSLPIGATIERRSRVVGMTEKRGRSGRLVFVEVEHAIMASGVLALSERQWIVWRENGGAPVEQLSLARNDPLHEWPWRRTVAPSEALLFRYAALTFNTNRLHFDWPYATRVGGYRGLVVQGPLIAVLLLDLAAHHLGEPNRLSRFSFKGQSPAIAGEPLHLAGQRQGDEIAFAALGEGGRIVMTAVGSVSPPRK